MNLTIARKMILNGTHHPFTPTTVDTKCVYQLIQVVILTLNGMALMSQRAFA